MDPLLDHAFAVLERTPATLDHLLRGLPGALLEGNEGEDTWSPREVLGHLVHGEETDWIPRARLILEHGEARSFEPFDRFAQLTRFADSSAGELLERFALRRSESLATLRAFGLREEDLARRGRHPDFGPVTLGQLLATWVVHDLGHIAQITRVMAKQHTALVGPWKQYLPVLSRT